MSDGLRRFAGQISPAVVADVQRWDGHPELVRLLDMLRAHTHPRAFFATYAEAVIARHLLGRGCELRFEVPTPAGRRCDFEVSCDSLHFYLHVKWLGSHLRRPGPATLSSRLRSLDRIERPYVVGVRWQEGLTDEQMEQFVCSASEFIRRARVGEELSVRQADGQELGALRVVAPWQGTHVRLVVEESTAFEDDVPRVRRLMAKAYRQFMPKATNVILIGSRRSSIAGAFDTALLGSHIERWDTHPPRGQRIAHGRDTDGLWSGGQSPESLAAGCFWLSPPLDDLTCRLWVRDRTTFAGEMESLLDRLLNGNN